VWETFEAALHKHQEANPQVKALLESLMTLEASRDQALLSKWQAALNNYDLH